MAVVPNNCGDSKKRMNIYRPNATFYDITEHFSEKVVTNGDGWDNFLRKGGNVSAWLHAERDFRIQIVNIAF